jgi:hypothetical protein
MDIDRCEAPLCGISFLANGYAKKCQMRHRAVVRVLTLKGLKAQEIEMELTSMYGNEALQISAIRK